jgi:hypothetical protein
LKKRAEQVLPGSKGVGVEGGNGREGRVWGREGAQIMFAHMNKWKKKISIFIIV